MKDPSLSPFFEQPSKLDLTQAASREKFARLEYELAALKTEKKLVEQSRDATITKYERLLSSKNDELAQLQNNFDFIYGSRKLLETSLNSAKLSANKSTESHTRELAALREENKQYKSKLLQLERIHHSTKEKYEHLRADLNCELTSNDQYRERVQELQHEKEAQEAINRDLVEQLKQSLCVNGGSNKEVESLTARVTTLQSINSDLQCKLDKMLQQKTGNEILKHKNASLLSQIKDLEGYKEKCSRLEQQNAALHLKFKTYFTAVAEFVDVPEGSDETTAVLNFALDFQALQNKLLVTRDKFNEAQTRISELEGLTERSESRIEQLLRQLDASAAQISEKDTKIASLRKTETLNQKEIEFLRNSLKDFDKMANDKKNQSIKTDVVPTSSGSAMYLANLEKLVDEYKQEIESLRKQLSGSNILVDNAPTKRPRLLDAGENRGKDLSALRNENLELTIEVKTLKTQIEALKQSLEQHNNVGFKSGSVLELRANPFAADQAIKQETLNVLRAENADLIARFIESSSVQEVPRSVYARQEHDKDVLQDKVDVLVKKMDRLKTVYAERSKDIISIISRFFGYSIEFIPNPINPNDLCSKLKLVSKYLKQANADGETPYLILDVRKRSMKAHGNYDFKRLCEDLVEKWVTEKYQIPCFLSALNLEIYSESLK